MSCVKHPCRTFTWLYYQSCSVTRVWLYQMCSTTQIVTDAFIFFTAVLCSCRQDSGHCCQSHRCFSRDSLYSYNSKGPKLHTSWTGQTRCLLGRILVSAVHTCISCSHARRRTCIALWTWVTWPLTCCWLIVPRVTGCAGIISRVAIVTWIDRAKEVSHMSNRHLLYKWVPSQATVCLVMEGNTDACKSAIY